MPKRGRDPGEHSAMPTWSGAMVRSVADAQRAARTAAPQLRRVTDPETRASIANALASAQHMRLCYWCGRYWVGPVYSAPQDPSGTVPWLGPFCSWECGASNLLSAHGGDAEPMIQLLERAAGRTVALCDVGPGHYTELMRRESAETGIPLRMLATPTGRAVWAAQEAAKAEGRERIHAGLELSPEPLARQMPPGLSGPGMRVPSPMHEGAPTQPPSSPQDPAFSFPAATT